MFGHNIQGKKTGQASNRGGKTPTNYRGIARSGSNVPESPNPTDKIINPREVALNVIPIAEGLPEVKLGPDGKPIFDPSFFPKDGAESDPDTVGRFSIQDFFSAASLMKDPGFTGLSEADQRLAEASRTNEEEQPPEVEVEEAGGAPKTQVPSSGQPISGKAPGQKESDTNPPPIPYEKPAGKLSPKAKEILKAIEPTEEEAGLGASDNLISVRSDSETDDEYDEDYDSLMREGEGPYLDEGNKWLGDEISAEAELELLVLTLGYPDPARFLDNKDAAAKLRLSECFRMLRGLPSEAVKSWGPVTFQSSVSSETFTVFEQMMLAVASQFYEQIPHAPCDPLVLEPIHMVYARAVNKSISFSSAYAPKAAECFMLLIETKLYRLVHKLGALLFKPEVTKARHFNKCMHINECTNSLSELMENLPPVYVIYKMIYQLYHGGLTCVVPVPVFCEYDRSMDEYLQKICVGGRGVPLNAIPVERRDPTLPIFSPPIDAGLAITSTAGKGKSIGQTIIVTKHGPSGYKRWGSRTPAPTRLYDTEAALNYQVRDTTMFREGVVQTAADQGLMHEVLESLRSLHEKVDNLMASIHRIENGQKALDASFASHIVQQNLQDLFGRVKTNQTLLAPSSSEAQQLILSAPRPQMPPAIVTRNVYDRFLAVHSGDKKRDPTLEADMKQYFTTMGDVAAANMVNSKSVYSAAMKNRFAQRFMFHEEGLAKVGPSGQGSLGGV